jgi:hypothetical protein
MKLLDKLLKKLNTDRNTFFTYLLTLITIYILIDRLTEFLLIVFTGVASSYWGPIKYTIAFACPVFAFLFSMSSKFIKSDDDKHGWFYSYCISLYILIITMVTEWFNKLCWLGLISLPGYTTIATDFAYLIKPALSSIAIALPLCTWFKLFDKLYKTVNDSKVFTDSLADYEGISLSDKKVGWGPYTNEILIGTDKDHGNNVKLAEIRRFESTLVVGVSGAGKTSMIFEPWVCQDINKKFFYRETSKTLAFAALKAGIATLNAPYDNNYINSNFSLNMLIPVESRAKLFKAYFNKMILAESNSKIIFRDLGITYMSPDYETIDKISKVCENFGFNYNIIDPNNPNSIGLNPFSFEDPVKTALAISTVLKGFYTDKNPEQEIVYRENLSNQIIENLAILLKIEYPKLNNDKLPNINDMLALLNNFDLIEKMCKILEKDPVLSKKYENQINYFKRNFYHDSPNRDEMEKAVSIPASQLDTLLRYPGVKNILCNRSNNLNFDNVLENGKISLVCTRRGDLGENAHKAFGLFFLLLMQFSVLRRPGTEKTRIPHFLYIDEFPDFICPATESIFTVYRKYRVATVISAQNLAQIKSKGENLGNTILANCANKLVFGNNTPEDNAWWSREIGEKKEWTVDRSGYNFAKDAYDDKGKVTYGNSLKYKEGKVQSLKFKRCMYKIRNLSGKIENGTAKVDFMPSKYKEKQKIKLYDFEKFSGGVTSGEEKKYIFNKFTKNNLANQHFTDSNDSPIKLDDSDLTFDINNDDAIVYTFKKGKKN